jgi:hypothetical protein
MTSHAALLLLSKCKSDNVVAKSCVYTVLYLRLRARVRGMRSEVESQKLKTNFLGSSAPTSIDYSIEHKVKRLSRGSSFGKRTCQAHIQFFTSMGRRISNEPLARNNPTAMRSGTATHRVAKMS